MDYNSVEKYEKFVLKMFKYLKIRYKLSSSIKIGKYQASDYIIYDKYGIEKTVEIKEDIYWSSLIYNRSLNYGLFNGKKIIIIFKKFDKLRDYNFYFEKYDILDISNILFLIRDSELLKGELNKILSYSLIDIIPEETHIFDSFKEEVEGFFRSPETKEDLLIEEIKSIKTGRNDSEKFEKIGAKVLKYIFDYNFYDWVVQRTASGGMYRFDLISKIKEQEGFWNMIKNNFNSRYIVFEFKNYENKITQEQIYTTEKYLYQKALRNVAIIVSREGLDKNAYRACSGALREQGKLILSLNQKDLINLLELRKALNNPKKCLDYMEAIFDKFMIDLEK